MLAYYYTFTNSNTSESFTIGFNDDGTTSCASGKGIILQTYPTFDLAVRNASRVKAGQHGIWDFFSFYGQRNISFQGIILGGSHADLVNIQDKIKRVLTLPAQPVYGVDDGYVNITWTDVNSISWSIDAKITSDVKFSRQLGQKTQCSFLLNLKSASPYILSAIEYTESQLRGWRMGGSTLPTPLGTKLSIGFYGVLNIYQDGTADSPGTYRMNGPATSPKITKLVSSYSASTTISDFSSGWSGGTEDIIHYQTVDTARKLTSTGAQDTMSLAGAIDLSIGEFITCYFYVDNKDNFALGDYSIGKNYIKFIDSVGVDEFVLELEGGNETIRDGWNYFIALKQGFNQIGTPSWGSITSVELSIMSKTGTTLNVTFDDLKSRDISFAEQKLELNTILTTSEYVDFNAQTGTIIKSDGTDVSSLLTSDSAWFYVTPKDNLFVMESSDANPNVTYEYPYTFKDPVDSTNIVGYWHFDDKNLTSIVDYVANNNGSFVGTGINYVPSPLKGSEYFLEFPGTGSYISYETPYRLLVVSKAAITLRFKTTSFASDFTLLYRYFGIEDSRIEYDQSSDELRVVYKIDSVTKTIAISNFAATYSVDTWYDITINFDNTSGVTVYLDNVSVGTNSTTGTAFDTSLNTARMGYGAAGGNLSGGLDEVRFYNDGTLDTNIRALLYYDASQEKYKNQVSITWNNAKL